MRDLRDRRFTRERRERRIEGARARLEDWPLLANRPSGPLSSEIGRLIVSREALRMRTTWQLALSFSPAPQAYNSYIYSRTRTVEDAIYFPWEQKPETFPSLVFIFADCRNFPRQKFPRAWGLAPLISFLQQLARLRSSSFFYHYFAPGLYSFYLRARNLAL